jgi:tRNA dimethylallyltransferase
MPAGRPLALVGPTASGKTGAAIALAEALDAEVVSVDSTTIYRGMDIGGAKPTLADRRRVPHHLVDVAEPDEAFTVAEYQRLARTAIQDIRSRGRRALLVGGSGLYFRAIVDDLAFPPTDAGTRSTLEDEAALVGAGRLHRRLEALDPAAARRIDPDNVRRTIRALEVPALTGRPFSSFSDAWGVYPPDRVRAAGVELPRDVLAKRIEARVRGQLAAGFVEEVRGLLGRGLGRSPSARQAIGYAEVSRFLAGETTLDEAVAATVKRTKALARRQMAWFRRDPRIRWFLGGANGAADVLDDLLEYLRG